jgi:DNA-binding transcriptional LysR family regulator
LAQELSFSNTALKLQIAQPAVSKQIKSLEEHFSTQLFLRNKKQVSLTIAGRNLYEEVYPLYHEIGNRVDTIIEESDELSGKVVFGCLSEVGQRIFVRPLNVFSKNNPKVVFEIRFMKGEDIVNAVKNGEVQIGIVSHNIVLENIRSYKVLEEQILLVRKRTKEKIQKYDFSKISFVSYRENDPLLEFYIQKAFPKVKMSSLQKKFIVNSHKSMVDIVKSQDLFAVLPFHSVAKEISAKTIEDIGPLKIKSNLYMIYLDLDYPERLVSEVSSYLRNYLKQEY